MKNPVSKEVVFKGDRLTTISDEGVEYVAMRPVVESIGLSWGTQQQKLERNKEKFGCIHMNIPSAGGIQEMLCIPLRKLNGWLFSINPNKVKESIREKLISYQEECFAALHDYWTRGVAVNPRRLGIMDEINQACADFKHDKAVASMCGRGLSDWKVIKPQHITRINRLVNEAVYLIDMYLADTGKGKITRA